MNDYIFTETYKQSRGGLMVSFPLWNKEMFLKKVLLLDLKEYGSIFRFGRVGGYMNLLKDMTLDTFEEIFPENPFSQQQITAFFRKEISLKYGQHKAKSELKALSKKVLEVGCHYLDFNGDEWVYLGKAYLILDKDAYRDTWGKLKNDPVVIEGLAFIDSYAIKYRKNKDFADRITVLKSLKKFKEKVEGKFFELPESKEFKYESGKSTNSYGFRGNERIVTVKFL